MSYEKLLQYLLANRAKLGYNAYKQVGSLKNDSIFIIREELGAILKELRFEDPAIIIKDWSKRDYLITPEGDRKITRKQFYFFIVESNSVILSNSSIE